MSLIIRGISYTVNKVTPKDVKTVAGKITGAVSRGYKTGKSTNTKTVIKPVYETKAIIKELKCLKFTPKEYPAIAAAIVALIPVPSPIPVTPIVYGIGKAIQRIAKFIR